MVDDSDRADHGADLVMRYYKLVDDGDWDAMLRLFSDDVVYRRPGYVPVVGRAEMATFYRSIRPILDGVHRIEDVVGDRTMIAVKGVFDGRLVDGTPVAIRFADFFRIRDGLVIERDTYFDAPGV